jgi:hypothetical protein
MSGARAVGMGMGKEASLELGRHLEELPRHNLERIPAKTEVTIGAIQGYWDHDSWVQQKMDPAGRRCAEEGYTKLEPPHQMERRMSVAFPTRSTR